MGGWMRDQRHVRIRRDGDRPEQFRCKLRRQVYCGGAVCAADDADRGGLRAGEAQYYRAEERHEYAELSRRAEQKALGVGKQGPKSVIAPTPMKMSDG